MPPKMKTPAPIDRPLSRAYLREFTGWSTAYPPGLSDPASLRLMENVMVNRDGSARVRPGLRYLSYDVPPVEGVGGQAPDLQFVGTHEPFYLNDGSKAYLCAVREIDGTVGFRVYTATGSTHIYGLTSGTAGFTVPQGEAVLNFSAETTYVKYLQIDNKIFALSNAGETMRLFTVGETKTARKLSSIDRPNFDLADKLLVVHPDAAWSATPVVRKNLLLNPSFETTTTGWTPDTLTELARSTAVGGRNGGSAARLTSLPTRTNLIPSPLHDVGVDGIAGWSPSDDETLAVGAANTLSIESWGSSPNRVYYAISRLFGGVVAGKSYKVAHDLSAISATDYENGSTLAEVTPRTGIFWYNSSGGFISSSVITYNQALVRKVVTATAPAGATQAKVYIGYEDDYSSATLENNVIMRIKNVLMAVSTESTNIFSGDSGVDYLWTGTDNDSSSVYHPPVDLKITHSKVPITAGLAYVASGYAQADPTVRQFQVGMNLYNASSVLTETEVAATVADVDDVWTRHDSVNAAAAATSTQADVFVKILAVPRGEYHYVDSVMLEQAAALDDYFDGDDADTATVIYAWEGTAHSSASTESTFVAPATIPPAETPTANTLIDSTATDNVYNFGYFYTFSNEIGESASSQVTVTRAQRPWAGWKWEQANASGEPNGTLLANPELVADQLVAYMPEAVYDAAKAQGAISWSLYMMTWSNQDSVPTEGVLIGTKEITSGGTYAAQGWIRHTPQTGALDTSAQLPSASNRRNYSEPSSGAQGIVAADRLVMVGDPHSPAVIRWSSNQQGEYTNFTAAKGGGYKTLTSGNLYIPIAVKLWQNPQSVDTLTILCEGVDGQSTGYYMAPSQVTSQSESTTIMGFEETTATPGTVSPYGCEVLNNSLYHPIDTELMKSTASNYNINHKTMTEQIEHDWVRLSNKHRIVSSQHDNRLYYIVHNPLGAELDEGCMGNEIWVFDSGKEGGTWSRWLIQAVALRKIEYSDKVYMSVVRPDGIYYLDPLYDRDDVVDPGTFEIGTEFIGWKFETNTQGANRAHDAWAHLQQITMALGNFQGTLRWGVRSWDIHGKAIDVSKVVRDLNAPSSDLMPFDILDHLQVRRDLMEWFLYAESVNDADTGEVLASSGQINYVQYRYTPVSVNVGYEYGSVETFEYARATVNWADRNTDNGVPIPAIDTRRP